MKSQIILREKVNARLFFCREFDYSKFFLPSFLTQIPDTKLLYKKRFEACFLKTIEESNTQSILLSEEAMSQHITTLPDFIEVLHDFGFNVKIIAYIRPAVDWLVSLWKQRTKISMTCMNLKKYCYKSYDFMALNQIYFLIKTIGKENVILRPYEKEQWKNNSIIDDFLSIFDIKKEKANFHEVNNQNISSSMHTTELCRLLTSSGAIKLNYQSLAREKLLKESFKMKNQQEFTIKTSDESYLNDKEILDITEKTRHLYTRLANIYDKESFFINEFPKYYEKERAVHNTLTINQEELGIVLDALEKNRQEKDTLIKELEAENKKLLEEIECLKT